MKKNYTNYQKKKVIKMSENQDKGLHKSVINWYPGHMAKTKREIKEKINLIDIIYEVCDARIPFSSRINDIDDIVREKPHILIMSKYDLCDQKETDKFIEYYESKGFFVLKKNLLNDSLEDIFTLSRKILKEKIASQHLKGINKTTIRALVIGIPNAGKSTLINKLVGKKIAKTGNKPGVTKSLSWIRVRKDIELLDTPGVLWPKLDQEKQAYQLAATTAIKEEILDNQEIALYILTFLEKYYPELLKKYYDLETTEDYDYIIQTIGKKWNLFKKGGLIDENRVLDLVINDVKQGKLKGVTFDRSDLIE